MPSYPGSRKIVTLTVKDEDDVLTDADLTVTVATPDGSVDSVDTIDPVSTGVYSCVVDCPAPGRYTIRAAASGAVVAVDEDSWRIEPSLATWP
jgi:ABC-type transport system substrate-binding protein